jgi:hypothetical protein
MDLATNYDKIFENRLVLITGVARSGTTLMGKIIGSFDKAIYLFEPTTFLLIPPLIKKGSLSKKEGAELLKSILFEDFYLQMIHGRYVNFNKNDDSYIGNYTPENDVKKAWDDFERKNDVLEYLKDNDYFFVLKAPSVHPFLDLVCDIFKDVKIIDIVRNGNDVVSSSMRRDMFSDIDLNERNVDWSFPTDGLKVPWFIDEKDRVPFKDWNYQTRVAHMWNVLTEASIIFSENNKNVFQLKYDDFIRNPISYLEKIESFLGRRRTSITDKHVESIKTYSYRDYPDISSDLSSPVKEKYIDLQKKLGYMQEKPVTT